MNVRKLALAAAAAAALLVAPAAFGAQVLQGKVVTVAQESITVTTPDGKTVTYVVPSEVQVQAPDQRMIQLVELRPGQTVHLTVEPSARTEKPQAQSIRIDGDLEIESDVEIDD